MKRRTALTSLAILITPLALGVPTAHASGDDEHDDDSELDDDSPESTSPSIPLPSTPGSSIPSSSIPGALPSRAVELRTKLNEVLAKINKASISDAVKNDLRGQVQSLLGKLASGQRIEGRDIEALLRTIETAIRANRPAAPGASIAPPSSIDVGGSHDGDDESDDDSDSDSEGDDEDGDHSDNSLPGIDDSSGRPRFDIDKIRRDGETVRGDITANIARATAALNTLPQSETRDSVLATLAALQSRVDAGETIPFDEARAVFRAAARLVYERIGQNPDDDDDAPAPGELPAELARQRMLGAVNQALDLLAGNTTDAGLQAVAALEAVKATLDAGETPTRDDFENAMHLAREVLEESPGAKALLTLAGVISAVTASDLPDNVKSALLGVLEAAKDRILTDPTVDAKQIVRDALTQVREARITATVQRMLEVATRLENLATEVGNGDATLLIAEARALLQPSDATLPTRGDLHHARRILVRVATMLATTPPTTTPPTSAPSGTDAPSTTVV
ncbi:MAG: hypothetical protein ACKOCE_05210 [Acidimicrobiia bacterium]